MALRLGWVKREEKLIWEIASHELPLLVLAAAYNGEWGKG